MKKAVIGIVERMDRAERLVQDLRRLGFTSDEISALLPGTEGTNDFARGHTRASDGAAVGAGAGMVVGSAIGLLSGIGALAIPGVGPFIAAGPLVATLSGAAAGATVGGLAGALVGLGIPETQAKLYEGKIRNGNVLVAVHTEDPEMRDRASKLFKLLGARDVATVAQGSSPSDEPVP